MTSPTTIPQPQVDAAMSMLAHYGVPEDKARIALYAAHSAKVPDQSEDKMMSETKTPWEMPIGAADPKVSDIFSDGDFYILPPLGEAGPVCIAAGEANAALIVRAVNSHEALVAALDSLIRHAEMVGRLHDFHFGGLEAARATLSQARA